MVPPLSTSMHSLCLANLDDQALEAAASALSAKSITTGLTINDSITISRDHPTTLLEHDILQVVQSAAAARRGYDATFTYLPCLRKHGEPEPTLHSVARALHASAVLLLAVLPRPRPFCLPRPMPRSYLWPPCLPLRRWAPHHSQTTTLQMVLRTQTLAVCPHLVCVNPRTRVPDCRLHAPL